MTTNIDEEAVVASMMMSSEAADEAFEILKEDDFFHVDMRVIFKAMRDLSLKGLTLDVPSVGAELEKRGQIQEVGGAVRLLSMIDNSMQSSNPKYHIENLRNGSILRSLKLKFTGIIQDCNDGQKTGDELLERAEKILLEISSRRVQDLLGDTKKALYDYLETIAERQKNGAKIIGISTGFGYLDGITCGLRRGNLIILAARPSVGKTSMALDFTRHLVLNDQSVAFFSLEQTQEEIINRIVSGMSGVAAFDLIRGKFKNDRWAAINQSLEKLHSGEWYLNCSGAESSFALRSACRKIATKLSFAGKRLALIIVDYLQLMGGDTKSFENRQNEVSQISRSLKRLAVELDVPVLALSQLNRKPEERAGGVPLLSDLRESGGIEQDADLVIMLWREVDSTKLAIRKHRNGALGEISLHFDKLLSSFKEIDKFSEGNRADIDG